jgi:hypothetical protein
MVRAHLRLLAYGASADQEVFPRTQTVEHWGGPRQKEAWESGVEDGGRWACAV